MNMKVIRPLPTVTIEVEGNTHKEVMDRLVMAEEIFGERCCGLCGNKNIVFRKRVVDGNDFYEMVCTNFKECGAKLSFGQSKQKPGELFPIRKLITSGPETGKPSRKNGEFGPHNGWTKFRGLKNAPPVDTEEDAPPPPQSRQQSRPNQPRGGQARF